ncbi:hypothetical protein KJ644_00130 [Candidatus Dependentiae bacterium]|nr:hypothetical protein [Candidatus Dependentiae bacterium]MBU4386866.1 hypothetical protein [Candidatus Dependentiae bacterium]MCG2756475.1 hypothetical protein [Candidatus Dependentiae bacterium]
MFLSGELRVLNTTGKTIKFSCDVGNKVIASNDRIKDGSSSNYDINRDVTEMKIEMLSEKYAMPTVAQARDEGIDSRVWSKYNSYGAKVRVDSKKLTTVTFRYNKNKKRCERKVVFNGDLKESFGDKPGENK